VRGCFLEGRKSVERVVGWRGASALLTSTSSVALVSMHSTIQPCYCSTISLSNSNEARQRGPCTKRLRLTFPECSILSNP